MEKILEVLRQGKPLVVGECRGAKPEVIEYVDKKTGQAAAFTSLKYLIEINGGTQAVQISQAIGDGKLDIASVKIPVVKGKVYAFELQSLLMKSGIMVAKMPAGAQPIPG